MNASSLPEVDLGYVRAYLPHMTAAAQRYNGARAEFIRARADDAVPTVRVAALRRRAETLRDKLIAAQRDA